MKFKLSIYIILVPVFLFFAACAQPVSQSEAEFFSKCEQIQKNIEHAQSLASELEHFKWDEFSGIGVLCPPEGICPVGNLPVVEKTSVDKTLINRVVSMPEYLPNPKTAETYSVQCANCLKLARALCSNSPYNRPPPSASENITDEWQQSCSQLQSALQGAEYLVSRDNTIAEDYTFPKLFAYFSVSDEKVKQKYLEKFTGKTDDYINLNGEMIRNLQQANEMLTVLFNWQFTPQTHQE
jgi:hypothetical protein